MTERNDLFYKKKCSQKMNAFKIIFIVQHMRSWEPKIGKKKTSTGFVKNAQKIAEQQYKQNRILILAQ